VDNDIKEEGPQDDLELGHQILGWLRAMPKLEDLHKMMISLAAVSTKENGGEIDAAVMQAISDWANMLCQNLEMVNLFGMQYLIARVGDEGSLEVDFSREAAEIIKQAGAQQEENAAE